MTPDNCCILNGGDGAWAFAPLAQRLSTALWIDVSETPRAYNYLLHLDQFDPAVCGELFIPYQGMQLAGDKRLLAELFSSGGVPVPETHLIDSLAEAEKFAADNLGREWCIKFPTGCASGHRMLTPGMTLPRDWPMPLVVQEFVRLEQPAVYRLYCAGGSPFGWVVRKFPAGIDPSPWVAHARGARYMLAGEPPKDSIAAARMALEALGLWISFGCADLIRRPNGEWLVLEAGTDGMFNHVDRDIGIPELEREIQRRIAEAFWSKVGEPPWRPGLWRPNYSPMSV